MSSVFGPRKRTGPKPKFTRQDVIAAALRQGLGYFTFAAIARELDVSRAALYREFSDPQALEMAGLAQLSADISWPECDSWQELLHAVSGEVWECFNQSRGVDLVVLSTPTESLLEQDCAAALIEILRNQGFGEEGARMALRDTIRATAATHLRFERLSERLGGEAAASQLAELEETEKQVMQQYMKILCAGLSGVFELS